MKKTVTINISGIIFSIDEDAYNKLKIYLDTIKGYFRSSDGVDEIMADIEARIAEMLQEKINEQKQVVIISDVNEIISVMGQPEDYIDEEEQHEYEHSSTKSNTSTGKPSRKLYRDPDNQVIGGVCSGISHYLAIDPIWIRLALVITLLTFGTGILLYIILWVIIPLAETRAEKLEMRGDPINIDNIGKSVEDEIKNVKKKFSEIANSDGRHRTEHQIRQTFRDIAAFFVKLVTLFFKIFGKLIGIALITAGIVLIFGFLVGVFNPLNHLVIFNTSHSIFDLAPFFFHDEFDSFAAFSGIFLITLVPLLAILYGGMSFFVKFKGANRGIGLSLVGLWILGWIFGFYAISSTTSDFADSATDANTIELMSNTSDTLYLTANLEGRNQSISKWKRRNNTYFSKNNEYFFQNNINVDVQKSRDENYYIEIIKEARADDYDVAKERAQNIVYQFTQDSTTLSLNKYFQFPIENKWRNQNIEVIVRVPEGKTVYLAPEIKYLIYDIDNITNTHDFDMVGNYWNMTREGLSCDKFNIHD